jgi:hypothetical protein
MRNRLDKSSAAQSLDGWPSDREPAVTPEFGRYTEFCVNGKVAEDPESGLPAQGNAAGGAGQLESND